MDEVLAAWTRAIPQRSPEQLEADWAFLQHYYFELNDDPRQAVFEARVREVSAPE